MEQCGVIYKALSGFYYVADGPSSIVCRAPGRFRHEGMKPLVGDRVRYTLTGSETGILVEVFPRRNSFERPAVANIDQLIIIASNATPCTDPFLIDRLCVVAELRGCEPVICVNKCDLAPGDDLFELYRGAGFTALRVSALTGEGIQALGEQLSGKTSALTGNSGVGKSSLLNMICPDITIPVGEVSEKLGRGRHTTRHVEFFRIAQGTFVADTPGFSSFDAEHGAFMEKELLAKAFRDFHPYLDDCFFSGCSHTKEKGCAVLEALEKGEIFASRHESYMRLYQIVKEQKSWDL